MESIDAPFEGGEFTTPLVKFGGNRLELNVDTSAGGSVHVELLDEDGNPISNFSGEASTLQVGNSVRLPVTWPNGDLKQLTGKPVRLRFLMRNAKFIAELHPSPGFQRSMTAAEFFDHTGFKFSGTIEKIEFHLDSLTDNMPYAPRSHRHAN